MNSEQLHDAISLLPEDMLLSVDALRQKKRMPWKSIIAAAACLGLVVGLWLISPGNMAAMDSATGGTLEMGNEREEIHYSAVTGSTLVEVISVNKDRLQVSGKPSAEFADEFFRIPLATLTLSFENLEQIPDFKPGQTIRIYYEPEQFDQNNMTVKPYKIELIEEESS